MKFLITSINLAQDLGVNEHLKARAGFVNISHIKNRGQRVTVIHSTINCSTGPTNDSHSG